MELSFSADDVFEIAINMEARGERFYQVAASKAENEQVRQLFQSLSRDEVKHRARFEAKREQRRIRLSGDGSPESERWLNDFLQSWSDGKAFDGEDPEEFASTQDVLTVLKKALELEREVVAFYVHLKEYMPTDEEAAWVDKIMKEEGQHCQKICRIIERVEDTRRIR